MHLSFFLENLFHGTPEYFTEVIGYIYFIKFDFYLENKQKINFQPIPTHFKKKQ